MPTIRIKDLPTTASSSSSTDFLALDGSGNGTRKLSAFSPSFGGALSAASASFTTALPLTSGGTGATTQAGAANAVLPNQTSQSGKYLTTDGTNVSWGTVSTGGTWGSITGTLSNQTDLQNALNAKASLSGATFTGTITSTLGTLTASTPALDLSQTWNNAGVNFTGARINITNTASGASSYILDLRVGGASVLQIDKQGRLLYETNGGWQGFGFIGQGRAGMGYGSDTVYFFHNSGVAVYGYTDTRVNYDSSFNVGFGVTGAGTAQDIGFRRNAAGVLEINNGTAGTFRDLTLRALTASSTITDSAGNVRSIPQNSQTAAYTLVVGDNGKHISITTGGVTVPSGVFSAGQVVTIFNNSTINQTITQGASTTMYQAGTTNTGNRTLASYGVAKVLCVAPNTFVIAGSGIS